MLENNDFTVAKSEYRLINKYVAAFDSSQAKTLFDVYKKPSFAKKKAYAEHKDIVNYIIEHEWELPFEKCYETRITSFNQFMFTCVSKIEFTTRPYSVYVISTPSAIYVYYTTKEVIKILYRNDIDNFRKFTGEIAKRHP